MVGLRVNVGLDVGRGVTVGLAVRVGFGGTNTVFVIRGFLVFVGVIVTKRLCVSVG